MCTSHRRVPRYNRGRGKKRKKSGRSSSPSSRWQIEGGSLIIVIKEKKKRKGSATFTGGNPPHVIPGAERRNIPALRKGGGADHRRSNEELGVFHPSRQSAKREKKKKKKKTNQNQGKREQAPALPTPLEKRGGWILISGVMGGKKIGLFLSSPHPRVKESACHPPHMREKKRNLPNYWKRGGG